MFESSLIFLAFKKAGFLSKNCQISWNCTFSRKTFFSKMLAAYQTAIRNHPAPMLSRIGPPESGGMVANRCYQKKLSPEVHSCADVQLWIFRKERNWFTNFRWNNLPTLSNEIFYSFSLKGRLCWKQPVPSVFILFEKRILKAISISKSGHRSSVNGWSAFWRHFAGMFSSFEKY